MLITRLDTGLLNSLSLEHLFVYVSFRQHSSTFLPYFHGFDILWTLLMFRQSPIFMPGWWLLSTNIHQRRIHCKLYTANFFLLKSSRQRGTCFSNVLVIALPLDRAFALFFLDHLFRFAFYLHSNRLRSDHLGNVVCHLLCGVYFRLESLSNHC